MLSISNRETEEVITESFYWKYLANQAHAVCLAKKFGDANDVFAYTDISLRLARQFQQFV